MPERTFIMIKPDHAHFADEILRELDQYGDRTKTAAVSAVPQEIIEEHYALHRGKNFYSYMIASYVGKKVVIAVYEGDNIVQRPT